MKVGIGKEKKKNLKHSGGKGGGGLNLLNSPKGDKQPFNMDLKKRTLAR